MNVLRFIRLISFVAPQILRPLPRFTIVYHTRNSYKYVNAEERTLNMKEITDRAAQTMFWTEIFRGKQGRTQATELSQTFFACWGALPWNLLYGQWCETQVM